MTNATLETPYIVSTAYNNIYTEGAERSSITLTAGSATKMISNGTNWYRGV
jgi:hypothetical protein